LAQRRLSAERLVRERHANESTTSDRGVDAWKTNHLQRSAAQFNSVHGGRDDWSKTFAPCSTWWSAKARASRWWRTSSGWRGRWCPGTELNSDVVRSSVSTRLPRARAVLRSRIPTLVRQDFYALLLAHFGVW